MSSGGEEESEDDDEREENKGGGGGGGGSAREVGGIPGAERNKGTSRSAPREKTVRGFRRCVGRLRWVWWFRRRS